jgi:hypothetical protein
MSKEGYGTASGSCTITGFGVSGIEPSRFDITLSAV